ncbi:MAG: helix-turn-helix domain-containing protein [Pseudomonadota bacterium]
MMSEKRKQKNKDNLGTAIKDARIKEGYTQKALADALGLEYYTMISQMELGYISIPATLWVPLADTLRMDRAEWATRCVSEYFPEVYVALFDKRSRAEVTTFLSALKKGKLDDLLKY